MEIVAFHITGQVVAEYIGVFGTGKIDAVGIVFGQIFLDDRIVLDESFIAGSAADDIRAVSEGEMIVDDFLAGWDRQIVDLYTDGFIPVPGNQDCIVFDLAKSRKRCAMIKQDSGTLCFDVIFREIYAFIEYAI